MSDMRRRGFLGSLIAALCAPVVGPRYMETDRAARAIDGLVEALGKIPDGFSASYQKPLFTMDVVYGYGRVKGGDKITVTGSDEVLTVVSVVSWEETDVQM